MTGPRSETGTGLRLGLDWRNAAHWGGGRLLPCRHCGQGAFCRGDSGRPCHKTCEETVLAYRADRAPDRDDLDLGRNAA